MITLFIDTSSADVSIAIVKKDKILASIAKTIPNKHSIYTVQFLDDCLKNANLNPEDIEKIMVVTGPGSFTGIRIGVTIAKVYAYLKKIPIIPVSSLKMRALSIPHASCLSLIDARHENYYVGLYNEKNENILAEQFLNKTQVLEIIEKYHPTIVSNEEITLESKIIPKQELDILSIIAYYQKNASVDPHLVNPNYLKLPQALEIKND